MTPPKSKHSPIGLGHVITKNLKRLRSQARKVMFTAVKAKFGQNEDIARFLVEETAESIAEASKDQFFGIGYRLHDVLKTKSILYLGENVLGNILQQVKAELNGEANK